MDIGLATMLCSDRLITWRLVAQKKPVVQSRPHRWAEGFHAR